ncbi:MAG: fumarate hydratase [Archaeoglobaceae archaeon]|nr:fumarate hydratase [Archaeoglobaceae archaeon]MDW8117630.1 fumarate hydratase [Archaeoglobaceae archaeon]
MVEFERLVGILKDMIVKAHTELPEDVVKALKRAYGVEESEIARKNIEIILENIEIAKRMKLPICQDTGMPIFFVELGKELNLGFEVKDAIVKAVREMTPTILRPNAVHPITRKNSGDNTGIGVPIVSQDLVDGDKLRVIYFPKGAGSENVSALKMLLPTEVEKIKNFVIEVVSNAMGLPCPPVIIGVGIGGSFDLCAKLAKKAMLRRIESMNDFEIEILESINSLGIGPMGLGGKTTALAVLSEIAHCHTASLPVAVNIQCWAHRKSEVIL